MGTLQPENVRNDLLFKFEKWKMWKLRFFGKLLVGQIFEAGGPFRVTGGPFGPPVNMLAEALYQGELCETYPIDGALDTTSRRGFPGAIFPCSVVWLGGRVSRWEPILCFFNVILKNKLQENVCFGHLDVHEFERSP